jgi:hypothetical protein
MKCFLVAITLLLTIHLSAQLKEFTISEMPRPDVAVLQANAQFSDDALLLIYSTIEGLEFRSSLGGIDKQTYNAVASRYEVLIKPLKQMLFAAKQGYIEGKIATLNPQPKDVFYYRVEEKQNESPADAPPGKLQISSEPAGAEIFLNGFKVADKTPFTFDILGNTKIKLQKKDYETLDTSVIVTSTNTITLYAKLRPTFLYVNVSSNPSGASVWLDGVQLGATPLQNYKIDFKRVQRGNKTILIKAEGYDEISEVKNISPSIDPLDLSFNLKRQEASFTIGSYPPGASVFIDNVYRGVTPYTASKELGLYDVYVQLEGYSNSKKKQLVLYNSSAQQLNFSLQPEPTEAERELAVEADSAPSEVLKFSGYPIYNSKFQNIDSLRYIDSLMAVIAQAQADSAGAAAKVIELESNLGLKMILVPGAPYYLSETEITQGQIYDYLQAIQSDNLIGKTRNDYPQNYFSWEDAKAFCAWAGGRLPTVEEWQYAARGGGKFIFSGSNNLDEVAWYKGNSNGKPHPVKTKLPNGYGFYDMSGNVMEWTNTILGTKRALCGGGYTSSPEFIKIVNYTDGDPSFRDPFIGFRLLIPISDKY